MPILKLIAETPELALAPEDVETLVAAYKSALVDLDLSDRSGDAANILVAEKVIAVGRLGERDAKEICKIVVAALTGKPS